MKVFLTRRAEKDYELIKDYITQEWGDKTAETFTKKADEIFQLLESFPEMVQWKTRIFVVFSYPSRHEFSTEYEHRRS